MMTPKQIQSVARQVGRRYYLSGGMPSKDLSALVVEELEKVLAKNPPRVTVVVDGRSPSVASQVVASSESVRVIRVGGLENPVVDFEDLKGLSKSALLETLSDLLASSLQTGSVTPKEINDLLVKRNAVKLKL